MGRELLGKPYDVFRAYNLVFRLFLYHQLGIEFPFSSTKKSNDKTRIICTDVILENLQKVSPEFKSKSKEILNDEMDKSP
eukprot:UN21885